jgi:hypothetical protein
MKRREMNALSRSLCEFLSSRNNDIAGYWGIGMLCKHYLKDGRPRMSFRIIPGLPIRIYSCELTDSHIVSENLIKFELDTIEGRLSFFPDGRYPDGTQKYTCGISVAMAQGGRVGMNMWYISCWPHDERRERRRSVGTYEHRSVLQRLRNLLP